MACARCRHLEAELRILRKRTGVGNDARIAALLDWWRVTPTQVSIALALYDAPGPMTLQAMTQACPDGGSKRSVMVHVCYLRKAMDCEAIDTLPGQYALTEVGRAEIDRILEAAAQPDAKVVVLG